MQGDVWKFAFCFQERLCVRQIGTQHMCGRSVNGTQLIDPAPGGRQLVIRCETFVAAQADAVVEPPQNLPVFEGMSARDFAGRDHVLPHRRRPGFESDRNCKEWPLNFDVLGKAQCPVQFRFSRLDPVVTCVGASDHEAGVGQCCPPLASTSATCIVEWGESASFETRQGEGCEKGRNVGSGVHVFMACGDRVGYVTPR